MWSPLNSAAIPLLDSTVRVLSYSQAFELLGTLHSLEELEVEGIDTRSPILHEAIETTNRRLDSSSSELTRIALEAEWHVVYRTDASASRSDGFMWREEVSNFRKLERSVNIPARTGLVWSGDHQGWTRFSRAVMWSLRLTAIRPLSFLPAWLRSTPYFPSLPARVF